MYIVFSNSMCFNAFQVLTKCLLGKEAPLSKKDIAKGQEAIVLLLGIV